MSKWPNPLDMSSLLIEWLSVMSAGDRKRGEDAWEWLCTETACHLSDSQCKGLEAMFETLTEKLRDVPVKRRSRAAAEDITSSIALLLG